MKIVEINRLDGPSSGWQFFKRVRFLLTTEAALKTLDRPVAIPTQC